jgi:hypothetical protein
MCLEIEVEVKAAYECERKSPRRIRGVMQNLHICDTFVDDSARTSVTILVCLRTTSREESVM